MNYNEVTALIKKQGFDIKNVVNDIGMTYDGFKKSIENMTIEARRVIKLCKILNISPNELLDFVPTSDNGINISQNGGIGNQQTNINSSLAALERQLEEKDKQITLLLDIIKNK